MNLYKQLEQNAKKNNRTIIFPESYDARVLDAVKYILQKKIAKVILIRTDEKIRIDDHNDLDIIDIDFYKQYLQGYYGSRKLKQKDITIEQAEKELSSPLAFGNILLKNSFADGLIAGSVYTTTDVLRNAMRIIGLKEGNKTVSSFFLFTFPKESIHRNKIFAYGDCGVLPNPTAEQLSDIAIQTSENFEKLTGITPRTAFLSFSTKGSAKDDSLNKVIEAYKITKERKPDLICDGELQFDAAFVPKVAERKNKDGAIQGDANVFIFPDLNAGNIAYKITERLAGAFATGPIVQGLAKPVMDLSRGCNADDIVNMTRVISNL
ncbi:MAG: phosphate acetyltransferase [Ignavibacteria bacterium]|nr:phosphate acetyltransferase [Ignavibacteria bacterium]